MHKTHPVDAVDVVSAEWSDGSGGHQIGVELGHVVEAPDCSDLDDLRSWRAGRLQVKLDEPRGHDDEVLGSEEWEKNAVVNSQRMKQI